MNKIGNPKLGTENHYSQKLRNMTEEEREQHLAERKERKKHRMEEMTIKQAFREALNANLTQWAAEANNMMVEQVRKAKEGDTQAFKAVMEYLVGKPETQVDITSNGQTIQSPTIIFESEELDEWKDDDEHRKE